MSARTKDERINEAADRLYEALKKSVKYEADNCDCRYEERCDCDFCEAVKLIEWIDGKPLTL
jgi:hypothetical protein